MPDSLGMMLLQWNVCFERFVTLNPDIEIDNIAYGTRVLLPKDEPCYDYDAGGQFSVSGDTIPRLKYYEDGEWLAEPYYSKDVIYGGSVDWILREIDVCRDRLIAENYGLQIYGDRYLRLHWPSVDYFIPRGDIP